MKESDDRVADAVRAAIESAHQQDSSRMSRMWDQVSLYTEDEITMVRAYNTNLPKCIADAGCRTDLRPVTEMWSDARNISDSKQSEVRDKSLNVIYKTGTDTELDSSAALWRDSLGQSQKSYEQVHAGLLTCA